jgi:hypothetical protein
VEGEFETFLRLQFSLMTWSIPRRRVWSGAVWVPASAEADVLSIAIAPLELTGCYAQLGMPAFYLYRERWQKSIIAKVNGDAIHPLICSMESYRRPGDLQ